MSSATMRAHLLAQLQQLPDAMLDEMINYYQYLMYRRTADTSLPPLTKEQFVADIQQAERDIDAGNFSTLDDFRKESEQWD